VTKARVFPAKAFDIGGGQILPSPNQFYLTGEDRLRIVSVNSLPGVVIKLQCRTANPQGDTVAQSFDHVPNSDRSKKVEDYSIGDGSLLNVTVFAGAGSPSIGQVYVIVQLVRGAGGAAVVLGTILAGYVTMTQALGFPGSPIQSSVEGEPFVRAVNGTLPALGVAFLELVPTGARWELISVLATLATGVGAGDRQVCFQAFAPGVYLCRCPPYLPQLPSATFTYTWGANLPPWWAPSANQMQASFPQRQILPAGGGFGDLTFGFLGTDRWTALSYIVREWLEVP
jgi:hypothetical protein